MKVGIEKNCFVINGRETMLRAGEFHYSRVRKDQWSDRLSRMREAGLNTVSTYIMWNWHEIAEGVFDFSGRTHPQRDVEYFLDLVGESGLMLISRQGPWVCAEWLNGGYPQWLFDKHPEIMSLDSTGKVTYRMEPHAPVVSYLHPIYLDYSKKWFDAFTPLLKEFETKYPDQLLLVQADNETCYGFHAPPFEADYNPVNIGSKEKGIEGLYQKWLRQKYRIISTLNKLYGTKHDAFVDIEPPRSAPKNKGSLLAVFDWTAFKEDTVIEFLEIVAKMYRRHGIKATVSTNDILSDTLTIGSPYNIYKKSRHFFEGIDMYPSVFKDMLDVTTKVVEPVEIFKAQSPEKYPTSLEFQGGWYNAKVSLNTTHLHQRLSFAHGLKGLSYYMWVGGTNPNGWGTTGESYDYDCAIQEDGRDGRRLPVMKRFLEFTRSNEETILESEKVAEIGILYYQPYTFWSASINPKSAGLAYNIASEHSRLSTFETALQMLGFNLEYFDIEHTSIADMRKYKLLIAPLYEFLDKDSQEMLLDSARTGATIIVGPMIPYLGGNLEPCPILQDALKVKVAESIETDEVELVGSGGLSISKVGVLKSEADDAIVVAKVKTVDKVCGYLRNVGKGRIIVLGFLPSRLKDETEMKTFLNFLKEFDIKPLASSNQKNVNVVERLTPNGSALLYVSNLSEEEKEAEFKFIDPKDRGKWMEIQGVSIPKRSALVWPINLKTGVGEIKYLTSEIIGIEEKADETIVRAWGYSGTKGAVMVKLAESDRADQMYYKHLPQGMKMEFRSGRGAIIILVEGIGPFSDLP
jgi:beta-galactosidase